MGMARLPGSLSLKALLPLAIALFALAELAGWWTTIIIGLIVGLLAEGWSRALASGGLGILIGWGCHFLAYWIMAPEAFSRAISLVPGFLGLTLLLGLALGLLSSSVGYFAISLYRARKAS